MDHQDAEQLIRLELDRRTREWNRKLADMRRELSQKNELIEQQCGRTELMAYIQRRIAEERDDIAPELRDYVRGDTVEQVEAAIDRAKSKTNAILEGLRQVQMPPVPAGIPAPQPQAQQQPQSGPQQPQQLSLEQLKAVEVGSPEHIRLRQAYGIDRSRGTGLFG